MKEITSQTKLSELMAEYPYLLDEVVKLSDKFKVLKSPVMKLLLKTATIKDASDRSGLSCETIIEKLSGIIAAHEK